MNRARFTHPKDLQQFDNLSTPVWVFDVENHCIWWANSAGVTFWRAQSLEDLLDRDFSSDSQSVRNRLRDICNASTGAGQIQDTWTLYPKGVPQTVVITFQPILIGASTNGLLLEINRAVEVGADEEAIRMLEAIKAAALIVSTFSKNGELLAQNPDAVACYGRGSSSVLTLNTRLKDANLASELIVQVLDNQVVETETSVLTLNGERTHRIFARRGRDPITGDFVVVISEEDVTEQAGLRLQLQQMNERLEAEVVERTRRLSDSEERYELATRSADIWDWQIESNSLFVSPNILRMLGYGDTEFQQFFRNSGVRAFVHQQDQESFKQALINHLRHPEIPIDHEVRFLGNGSDPIWFSVRGVGVRGPDGRTIRSVGLLTDISERKRLEASLFAAQRLDAVGQLTGGIAHDFNNLLTVIGGNAELIALEGTIDKELTGAITQAVKRGSDLTRHLLAFSGKQSLQPKSLDVAMCVQMMRKTLLRLIGEPIEIITDIAPDLRHAHADPAQFESALLNAALNARDAMTAGGTLVIGCRNVVVTKGQTTTCNTIQEWDLTPGIYVEVSLTDNGCGMAPEELARAIEPFFTTKDVGKGSGLGLSMVYGFARQSGGDLTIESARDAGTTVRLYLPEAKEPQTFAPMAAQYPALNGRGESVLLVEDDPHVQRTLMRILSELNYAAQLAPTVDVATELLEAGFVPDLYLMDIVLPGGRSGLDFARMLKGSTPDCRIVLISGHSESLLDMRALHADVDAFLQKPFEISRLSKTLRTVLAP